jgi:hypothetical protein
MVDSRSTLIFAKLGLHNTVMTLQRLEVVASDTKSAFADYKLILMDFCSIIQQNYLSYSFLMSIKPSLSQIKYWSLSLLLLPAIASCNTRQPSTYTQPQNQPPPVATNPTDPTVTTQAPNRSPAATAEVNRLRQTKQCAGCNLSGANLQNIDLDDANLQNANLQGANLFRADLSKANLQGANLQGANLTDADLEAANLQGAALQNTSLQRSKLEKANLQGANITGANLQGADLEDAIMPDGTIRRS